jgi:hypothetical protein
VIDKSPAWTPLVRLDPMIERRHTNRRDFFEENVPPEVIYELTTAAEQEDASLVQLVEPEQRSQQRGCLRRPRPSRTTTPGIGQSLRHGRRQTFIGLTAFRSTQFRTLMPVPSRRLWFAISTWPGRDGCRDCSSQASITV